MVRVMGAHSSGLLIAFIFAHLFFFISKMNTQFKCDKSTDIDLITHLS